MGSTCIVSLKSTVISLEIKGLNTRVDWDFLFFFFGGGGDFFGTVHQPLSMFILSVSQPKKTLLQYTQIMFSSRVTMTPKQTCCHGVESIPPLAARECVFACVCACVCPHVTQTLFSMVISSWFGP